MMMVNFGTAAVATAVTILAPSLAMPPASYLRPTMKPVMFCRKTSGMPRCAQSSMKCAAFERALGEQDAVIGEDADRVAPDPGKAADQRLAVEPLELVELAAVDEPGDDLAHLIGPAGVGRNDPVDLVGRVERLARRPDLERDALDAVEIADDAARDAERMVIVKGIVVGDPGDPAVHFGAAQFLGGDDLAGCRAHQGRPAEKDRALARAR